MLSKCSQFILFPWRRRGHGILMLSSLIGLCGLCYICLCTPVPYYALDKLGLRYYLLPDFACTKCTRFNFSYVQEATSTCEPHSSKDPIFMLILVLTYHSNAEARKTIRNTWGGEKHYRGVIIKTHFVFGLHHDKNLNDQARHEAEKYDDVLQVQLFDDYRRLTDKVMISLWWAARQCSHVQYVLKTDDDSFNHPYRFVDYLLDKVYELEFVGGYCFTVYPDYREGSKHYVTPQLYPNVYYPTYCAGPGYVLSRKAIINIINNYENVKYLPMEDVFVTGIVREASGMGYYQIPGVVAGWHTLTPCLLATETKNAHNVWPLHMAEIWDKVLEGDKPDVCRARNVMRYGQLIGLLLVWCGLMFWMLR